MISLQELIILPGSNCAVLCHLEEDQIAPLQNLSFDLDTPHLIGGNSWIIALAIPDKYRTYNYLKGEEPEKEHPVVLRYKIQDNGCTEELDAVELPNLVLNKTMALYGDILFIGGYRIIQHLNKTKQEEWGEEICGFIDLSVVKPKWVPIPPPEETRKRSFDVVQVSDTILWLVNNIENKDYIAEYDVSVPTDPTFIRSFSAKEQKRSSIHSFRSATDWKLSLDKKWLAVQERFADNHSTTYSVNVYQLPNLEKILCVSNTHHDGIESDFDNDRKPFNLKAELEKARGHINMVDFNFTKDQLMIACNHHGMTAFVLDAALKHHYFEKLRIANQAETRFRSLSEPAKSVRIDYALENNQMMPVEMATVDKLVSLYDGRLIVISKGETKRQLIYKILK
jgi:hypothetical protein